MRLDGAGEAKQAYHLMRTVDGVSPVEACRRAPAGFETPGGDSSPPVILFFFSSRRRHTRYWRDWSSDVCSSDLYNGVPTGVADFTDEARALRENFPAVASFRGCPTTTSVLDEPPAEGGPFNIARSEERRVGKEWRSRWSPHH